MKKFLVLMLLVGLYYTWQKLDENAKREAYASAVAEKGVVLYSTDWCGYCTKTREYFASEGIDYTEYDIEKSDEGRRKYEALNRRGVPVVTVGDEVISGYNPGAIKAALQGE